MKLLSRIALGILLSPILIPVLAIGGLFIVIDGMVGAIEYVLTGKWG